MKDWFYRFNTREQLSLLLLGGALLLYLVYMVLWSPLDQRRDDMAQRNVAAAESLQRVDGMVSEILRLRETGGGTTQRRNLTGLINQTTASAGLTVTRMQPNSRGEVQVRMESVPFDGVMAWLNLLENREGLVVHEVSLSQSGDGGRVNATVRLAGGR
jgi:type II secretory pathway component PulM